MFGLFGLGLFLGTASTGIGIGFFQPRLFFGSVGCRPFRDLASLFLGTLLCLFFFLARLNFAFCSRFLLGFQTLFSDFFLFYAVFFFKALAIERVLLILGLLLKYIALDVGAFAANLDTDSTRTTLRAGEFQL